MHIGLNLFSEVIDDVVYVKPSIEDIESSDVTVRIHNSEIKFSGRSEAQTSGGETRRWPHDPQTTASRLF